MNEVLQTLFSKLTEIIRNISNYFKQKYKNQQFQLQAQQAQQNYQQMNANLYSLHCQIQYELFSVIYGKTSYPYLTTVNYQNDIILGTRRQTNQGKLFQFSLLSNCQGVPPLGYVLQQLRAKINFDIDCFRQKLNVMMTPQNSMMLYPCIMAGMQVVDIRANGIMIEIIVLLP